MARRLNFGSGNDVHAGWGNFDVDRSLAGAIAGAVILPDHGSPLTLPYDDESFHLVVANHSLCAIEHNLVPHWLGEIRRVLAPGGVLRALVPDMARALDAWSQGAAEWFPMPPGWIGTVDDAFCAYVTWFSENRSIFTGRQLLGLLQHAGFEPHLLMENVSCAEGGCELDSRISESLIVEGVKRA